MLSYYIIVIVVSVVVIITIIYHNCNSDASLETGLDSLSSDNCWSSCIFLLLLYYYHIIMYMDTHMCDLYVHAYICTPACTRTHVEISMAKFFGSFCFSVHPMFSSPQLPV